MTIKLSDPEPKTIVIIGGGVIGCSTAYFLTRHPYYSLSVHSIILLEASRIAGGSSGKAGGLLAEWATPKCLAPLSFKTHRALAEKHGGDRIWGHRNIYCADVELLAQELEDDVQVVRSEIPERLSEGPKVPPALDWLLLSSVKSYSEVGDPNNTGQVNPYMFTKTLAELAEEKGVKVILGSAFAIDYTKDKSGIESVQYMKNGSRQTLNATDILLAAGPWTTKLFPPARLGAPRGHSIVVRPSRDLSPYVLFTNITASPNDTLRNPLSPEIYPRPGDLLHDFDTAYACGPDDYGVPLPDTSDEVAVDQKSCNDIRTAVESVSQEIHDGEVITRQACYKPQMRPHDEGEEVGPMVGPTGIRGLWIATGHDEWGIQNAPGTGLVMSEMIFEGTARSADCEPLDPKHFLNYE